MAAKTFHQLLNAITLPDDWRAHGDFENLPGDIPFVLDIIPDGKDLHVYFSGSVADSGLIDRLSYSAKGKACEVKSVNPVPRGIDVVLDCNNPNALDIHLDGLVLNLPVLQNLTKHFRNQNTAFVIEIAPTKQALADWLEYTVLTHGLQAVVMLRRLHDDPNPEKTAKELLTAVKGIRGLKTLAILDCEIPLGDPNQPSIRERMTAPDAPGKALLEPPVNNAFESQVSEVAMLDAVRCRSFSPARATLFCTISDLLVPPSGNSTVFDAASKSDSYLKFSGVAAYPWSYAKPSKPRHADHLCFSFDGRSSNNIWCAGQKFMTNAPALRPFRASQIPADDRSARFSYWRCMGLRFPELKIGQMVPKSSLVLDHKLVETMGRAFSHTPKFPPAASQPKAEVKNDKIMIVTTMKNEGPFILEWLAFHMSIGVTDFCVYTNDCTDGTDDMFDLLAAKGLVEHRDNPYRETGQKPQHAAYHHAGTTDMAKSADWVICMDVDEYINIHVGDGSLHALFEAIGDANVISLTWRLFGNAEVDLFEDRFITEQFTRCAPHLARKPHQAWGFKTLFRNTGHYKKFGVHRPVGLLPEYKDQVKWVNGSGHPMPEAILRTGWRSSLRTFGYDLVTLNHYALRSAESFLVKRDRGRVNHVSRDQGLIYWFRMNNNKDEDRSIFRNLPRAREKFDALMADPEIAAQHNLCVANHRQRIAELKERPDYMAMYDEMMSERLIKLSRCHEYLGNATFMQGPDTIPEDFAPIKDVVLP